MSVYLVTGASGFLGTAICEELKKQNHTIIATVFSERNAQVFMKKFPEVKYYLLDLSVDYDILEAIFLENKIDFVIHCAAMKHVNICEKNPSKCIKTNVIGSLKIAELAKKHKVKNLVGISTDKSNKPSCTYGYSKKLMEDCFLEKKYAIYKGVNFFGSSGSVIDIWKNQMLNSEPITVNKQDTIRYFIKPKQVVEEILQNVNRVGIIAPKTTFRVSLHDLVLAFSKFYNYEKLTYFKSGDYEKHEEVIQDNIEFTDLSINEIIEIFFKESK